MIMRIPKIRLGVDKHGKSVFNYSNTNTTTMPFGLGQPVYGKEIINDSNVKVKEGAFIRLASMVLPSFCRSLKYITEATFVPYENLIKTYSLMKSEKPYSTSSGTQYYPKETPTADLSVLTTFTLVAGSKFSIWLGEDQAFVGNDRISFKDAVTVGSASQDFDDLVATLNEDVLASSITERYALNDNNDQYVSGDDAILPEAADFIIPFEYRSTFYLATFKLTALGRQYRNVLIGLGYKMTLSHQKVSTLPLWAYWKAYFDRNISHRYDENWEQTEVYAYLFQVMETNKTYIRHNDYSSVSQSIRESFYHALDRLADTFYYLDPDYFTVQLDQLSNPSSSLILENTDIGNLSDTFTSTYIAGGDNPESLSMPVGATATLVRQLLALQQYSNKSKVIGGLVQEYMYVHGLGSYLEEHGSISVHTQSYDIKVSDIDVTANSSADGNLSVVGDYAGKGIGSGQGTYEFHTKATGYFVIIGYIVPESGFYQGIDPCLQHYDKTSFYEPAFDSLGYQLTSQGEFFVNDFIGVPNAATNAPFGYLPRYFELKCKPQNIINGNVSLPSTRNNLMPYTLDRHITDSVINTVDKGSNTYDFTIDFPLYQFTASPNLRAVGKLRYLDNYDRIFYNSGTPGTDETIYDNGEPLLDDNFLIHHVFDVQAWSPMLSASYSFDTEAESNQAVEIAQA